MRLVTGGGPQLAGGTMIERRADFLENHDWIRTALMFEPRGHDMMSGAILYPSTREECDAGVLFIETSGCLPMCGHGTIGTVTMAIEEGLLKPRTPGIAMLDTPAGIVKAEYALADGLVEKVRITNVPSFVYAEGLEVECPQLGPLKADVSFGGNFYAIIEPQDNFRDMADHSASQLVAWSPVIRSRLNDAHEFVHPDNPSISGLSHVMWTGKPISEKADARNAVFYGEKAIDRSPCGTGTSARMAQLASRGQLKPGESFRHESIIGSIFDGRFEASVQVAGRPAIIPSISGWARKTGYNTIFVDDRDPYAHGFTVR